MGIDLSKYIANKVEKSEIVHSNVQARIAHGDNLGSIGNANNSFEKRLLKERQANRIVRNYKSSAIYNMPSTARNNLRLKLTQPRGDIRSAAGMAKRTARQNLNKKLFIPYKNSFNQSLSSDFNSHT
jgi:hypothetical protein